MNDVNRALEEILQERKIRLRGKQGKGLTPEAFGLELKQKSNNPRTRQKYSIEEVAAMSCSDLRQIKDQYRLIEARRSRAQSRCSIVAPLKTRDRAARILARCRKRAEIAELELDIDIEWIVERLLRGKCEVTNMEFLKEKAYAPSVDRTDSSLGYTKDNCKLVVWIYNRSKNEDSLIEVIAMSRAVLAKYG